MSSNDKGRNSGLEDDEGYISLTDYIPYLISRQAKRNMGLCKTKEEKRIWDTAIKECVKTTVLDAGGFPGPQVTDMYWLLLEDVDWRWEEDEEFIKELKDRNPGKDEDK